MGSLWRDYVAGGLVMWVVVDAECRARCRRILLPALSLMLACARFDFDAHDVVCVSVDCCCWMSPVRRSWWVVRWGAWRMPRWSCGRHLWARSNLLLLVVVVPSAGRGRVGPYLVTHALHGAASSRHESRLFH